MPDAPEPNAGAGDAVPQALAGGPARGAGSLAQGRIPELDGLRGAAILSVLCWHYVWCQVFFSGRAPLGLLARSLSLTWSGVDLFFVLSGFLIGGILLDNRESPVLFRTFYLRRVCRIFPLYYLVLLSAFALGAQGSMPAWTYALFTQNFTMARARSFGPEWLAPTWSLAIEEQFYLALPVLVWLIPRARLPYVLVAGIVGAPCLRLALLDPGPDAGLRGFLMMPARADALLLGVLGAWAVRGERLKAAIVRHRRLLGLLLIALLAGAAVMGLNLWLPFSPRRTCVGLSWLAATYAVALLLAVLDAPGIVARLARLHWLGVLGRISYGVYLLHMPFLGMSKTLLPNHEATATLLALASTLCAAGLSWHYLEHPLLRWGHRARY